MLQKICAFKNISRLTNQILVFMELFRLHYGSSWGFQARQFRAEFWLASLPTFTLLGNEVRTCQETSTTSTCNEFLSQVLCSQQIINLSNGKESIRHLYLPLCYGACIYSAMQLNNWWIKYRMIQMHSHRATGAPLIISETGHSELAGSRCYWRMRKFTQYLTIVCNKLKFHSD